MRNISDDDVFGLKCLKEPKTRRKVSMFHTIFFSIRMSAIKSIVQYLYGGKSRCSQQWGACRAQPSIWLCYQFQEVHSFKIHWDCQVSLLLEIIMITTINSRFMECRWWNILVIANQKVYTFAFDKSPFQDCVFGLFIILKNIY